MVTSESAIKFIQLEDYWKNFKEAIEQLSKKLDAEKEGKSCQDFIRTRANALKFVDISRSMKNRKDPEFRKSNSARMLLEYEHLMPGSSLKITSKAMLLFAEIYYEHLYSFKWVHSDDGELDIWLQEEKLKKSTANKIQKLKEVMEAYRQQNQLPTKNYNNPFEASVQPKIDQDNQQKDNQEPDEVDIEFLDASARRMIPIEKELSSLLSVLSWPAKFMEVLNPCCLERFNIDPNRFQIIIRAGEEPKLIPNLSFETLKLLQKLSFVKTTLLHDKDKLLNLKSKMLDLDKQYSTKKQELVLTKASILEQKLKLDQEKRIREQQLRSPDASKTSSPAKTGYKSNPASSIPGQSPQNVASTNPKVEGPNSNPGTLALSVANLSISTSGNNGSGDSLLSPSAQASQEAQRQYELFLSSAREIERNLNLNPVNKALDQLSEDLKREYLNLLSSEKNKDGENFIFVKLKNTLELDLKLIKEEEDLLSNRLVAIDCMSDLYRLLATYFQSNYVLLQNPRIKTHCNQYFNSLLNLKECVELAANLFSGASKMTEACAGLLKGLNEEYETVYKLLKEYHKVMDDSPLGFKPPYKSNKFKPPGDVFYLENLWVGNENLKKKRPNIIPEDFFVNIPPLHAPQPDLLGKREKEVQASDLGKASKPTNVVASPKEPLRINIPGEKSDLAKQLEKINAAPQWDYFAGNNSNANNAGAQPQTAALLLSASSNASPIIVSEPLNQAKPSAPHGNGSQASMNSSSAKSPSNNPPETLVGSLVSAVSGLFGSKKASQ